MWLALLSLPPLPHRGIILPTLPHAPITRIRLCDAEDDPLKAMEARLAAMEERLASAKAEEVVADDAVESMKAKVAAAEELVAQAAEAAKAELAAEQELSRAEQEALDRESSAALYAALDSLENDMKRGVDEELFDADGEFVAQPPPVALDDDDDDGPTYAASSTRASSTVQQIESLALEARSFVQGVRSQLETLQDNIVQKLQLEAKVAVSIAEFVLRRALLDAGRALTAAGSQVAGALGAAPPSPPEDEVAAAAKAREEAMPFASRLDTIEKQRTQSRLLVLPPSSSEVGQIEAMADDAKAEVEEAATVWAAQAEAQREGVEEAAELLKDGIQIASTAAAKAAAQGAQAAAQGAQSVLNEMSSQMVNGTTRSVLVDKAADALAAAATREEEALEVPDLSEQVSAFQERAQKVGDAIKDAANAALDTTRADYESYMALKESGNLPTLLEEAEDVAKPFTDAVKGAGDKVTEAIPKAYLHWVVHRHGGGGSGRWTLLQRAKQQKAW